MDVADAQCAALPQQVGAVVTAVVPYGFTILFAVVGQCRDGRRGRYREILAEPFARPGERFHADFALAETVCHQRDLDVEPLLHTAPGEGVFLPGLRVGECEAGFFEHRPEEPLDPLAAAAAVAVDGFQRDHPLQGSAHAVVVLVDRVAAQHAEYGDGDLSLAGLCGHVGVDPAGIISLVPVAAPQRVAVGTYLVFAVARSDDAVFVVHVPERIGVDEP